MKNYIFLIIILLVILTSCNRTATDIISKNYTYHTNSNKANTAENYQTCSEYNPDYKISLSIYDSEYNPINEGSTINTANDVIDGIISLKYDCSQPMKIGLIICCDGVPIASSINTGENVCHEIDLDDSGIELQYSFNGIKYNNEEFSRITIVILTDYDIYPITNFDYIADNEFAFEFYCNNDAFERSKLNITNIPAVDIYKCFPDADGDMLTELYNVLDGNSLYTGINSPSYLKQKSLPELTAITFIDSSYLEDTIFEAFGQSGAYITTFFKDGNPYPAFDGYNSITWNINDKELFRTGIDLKDISVDSKIFLLTLPLTGEDNYHNGVYASYKYIIKDTSLNDFYLNTQISDTQNPAFGGHDPVKEIIDYTGGFTKL